jgi:hypothetical protein
MTARPLTNRLYGQIRADIVDRLRQAASPGSPVGELFSAAATRIAVDRDRIASDAILIERLWAEIKRLRNKCP